MSPRPSCISLCLSLNAGLLNVRGEKNFKMNTFRVYLLSDFHLTDAAWLRTNAGWNS